MDTMLEASSRPSTALPPIARLEAPVDKSMEQFRPRHTLPSPSTFRFESSSQSKTSPTALDSVIDTHKSPADEHPRTDSAAPVRQSLPSIHEALGPDTTRPYNSPRHPLAPGHVPTSSPAYFAHPTPLASASNNSRRSSPTTCPPHSNSVIPTSPQPVHRSSFASGSAPTGVVAKNPSIQPIHTGRSPPYSYVRSTGQYTPGLFSPSPHSAPVHATYPYPSHHHTQYPPSSATSTAPGSQAHLTSAPPPHSHWSGEPPIKSPARPLRAHDSSVRRGLDQFDLEASFYELNQNGKRICDFGEEGAREVRRIKNQGGAAVHVPTPSEIEEMSQYMANMQRAFHRIQEISQSHHAEAQAQQKEMRRRYESISGDSQDYLSDALGNGSSMPPDAKKRRGRAAPPGRCHSCNRAETPEWRRGPDGARTLCNACGLHYAKLTRKMGPQQKAGISSSNLRPKGS